MNRKLSHSISVLSGVLAMGICSCQKDLTHEKFILNTSTDTVFVDNPDFDTLYFEIPPGEEAMIYSFLVLDKEQPKEPCLWLGDTLIIVNEDDSACKKMVKIEENWTSVETIVNKERFQKCTFTITDDDF